MSSNYQINVRNQSVMSPNGQAMFAVATDVFAVCGATAGPLGPGQNVAMGQTDSTPVTLASGTSEGTVPAQEVEGGIPRFVQPFGTTSALNSFGIAVNPYNPAEYPNVYSGYGKYDVQGNIVPALTWPSKPATLSTVEPRPTFVVGAGNFKPGEVVDINMLGSIQIIDFTTVQPGVTVATTTQQADGTWSQPIYSSPQ